MKKNKLVDLVLRYRDALEHRPMPVDMPGCAGQFTKGENPDKIMRKIIKAAERMEQP